MNKQITMSRFTFIGWIITVILSTSVVCAFRETFSTKPSKTYSLDISRCQAAWELLITSSSPFSVRVSTVYPYERDRTSPTLSVSFRSKDKSFADAYESTDVCAAIEKSWQRLEAYDAYVNERK